MRANAVYAFKVTTGTTSGAIGLISTMNTTGASATRVVGLSTSPGVFSTSLGRACLQESGETTSNKWVQGVAKTGYCQLPTNSTAWINIKFTNCASTNCNYYLKAN